MQNTKHNSMGCAIWKVYVVYCVVMNNVVVGANVITYDKFYFFNNM
jgi:hypothetical protein